MKTFLFLSLFMPTLLTAQINPQAFEIMQRQKFYETGDWSSWLRRENAEYRYHWGLNPVEDVYQDMIDVTFEIRNKDNKKGWWVIDIVKCNSDEVISQYYHLIPLEPNELGTVTFLAPNCGTTEAPRLHYKIHRVFLLD